MFDLSQLVQIEYITLSMALLFASMGFKYNKPILGLIVAFEFLFTTFMVRHNSMSYYLYEGVQEELAWIFYNTSIILTQTIIIVLVAYFFKSPLILFYYACQLITVIASFILGQMSAIAPDSTFISQIQSSIDDTLYWYVYWLSLIALVIGIMKNGSKGGRGINIVRIFGDNMLNNRVLRSQLARVVARIKRRVQGS